MSYELKINAKDRAAAQFIGAVRKALLRAAFSEKQKSGVTQQSIAKKLEVNRSVINRMLRGESNLTLRSVGELAWALGLEPEFMLEKAGSSKVPNTAGGHNYSKAFVPQGQQINLSDSELAAAIRGSYLRPIENRRVNDNFPPVEVAA